MLINRFNDVYKIADASRFPASGKFAVHRIGTRILARHTNQSLFDDSGRFSGALQPSFVWDPTEPFATKQMLQAMNAYIQGSRVFSDHDVAVTLPSTNEGDLLGGNLRLAFGRQKGHTQAIRWFCEMHPDLDILVVAMNCAQRDLFRNLGDHVRAESIRSSSVLDGLTRHDVAIFESSVSPGFPSLLEQAQVMVAPRTDHQIVMISDLFGEHPEYTDPVRIVVD